jgi:hypothetical protein
VPFGCLGRCRVRASITWLELTGLELAGYGLPSRYLCGCWRGGSLGSPRSIGLLRRTRLGRLPSNPLRSILGWDIGGWLRGLCGLWPSSGSSAWNCRSRSLLRSWAGLCRHTGGPDPVAHVWARSGAGRPTRRPLTLRCGRPHPPGRRVHIYLSGIGPLLAIGWGDRNYGRSWDASCT